MSNGSTFDHNYLVLENLLDEELELLIAKYIYGFETKVIKCGYKKYFLYKVNHNFKYPKRKIRSIIHRKMPYDRDVWAQIQRFARNCVDAVALAKFLDMPIHITINGNICTGIYLNKYAVADKFSTMLAKICLLIYLDKNSTTLQLKEVKKCLNAEIVD